MKRAYLHTLNAVHDTKRGSLLALFPAFRTALKTVLAHEVRHLQQGGTLPRYVQLPKGARVAGLSARQMKTVGNMTRNALLSWQALLERAVRAIINGSTLTDRERMVLHRVNTRHAWWANNLSLPWVENGDGGLRPCTMRTRNMLLLPVPAYLLKLSRRIVKHAITRTPIPDLSHVRTLVLDAIIAKPERPHAHTDTRFGWWIRVATLTKGKPVLIPVDRNEYFEQQYAHAIKHGGGLCGVIQLTRHDNGTLSCALVLDRPDAPMRMDGKPLGIDYGMADALMADSDGNLMGHAMLATLKRYDLRLTRLGAWLQRRHIKPSTNHEYRRLQHRIRAYVANEIGRILNRVAARHGAAKVRELIVERLDFRYGGMSPRMNRLITRIGRAVFKQRLAALTEKHGIAVCAVPAPYTSQECSGCGYVSPRNRPARARFTCRFCNKKQHADVNAARVIMSRRSWQQPDDTGPASRRNTLRMLDERFRQRWDTPAQGAVMDVAGAPCDIRTATTNGENAGSSSRCHELTHN